MSNNMEYIDVKVEDSYIYITVGDYKFKNSIRFIKTVLGKLFKYKEIDHKIIINPLIDYNPFFDLYIIYSANNQELKSVISSSSDIDDAVCVLKQEATNELINKLMEIVWSD